MGIAEEGSWTKISCLPYMVSIGFPWEWASGQIENTTEDTHDTLMGVASTHQGCGLAHPLVACTYGWNTRDWNRTIGRKRGYLH